MSHLESCSSAEPVHIAHVTRCSSVPASGKIHNFIKYTIIHQLWLYLYFLHFKKIMFVCFQHLFCVCLIPQQFHVFHLCCLKFPQFWLHGIETFLVLGSDIICLLFSLCLCGACIITDSLWYQWSTVHMTDTHCLQTSQITVPKSQAKHSWHIVSMTHQSLNQIP